MNSIKEKVEYALESVDFYKSSLSELLVHWKVIAFAFLVSMALLWGGVGYLLLEEEVVRVSDTQVKSTDVELVSKVDPASGQTVTVPKNIDTYFVYTDKGAFVMKENWFYLQMEVATTFGKLEKGKSYRFYHLGMRLPMFDMFENVLFVKDLETNSFLWGW